MHDTDPTKKYSTEDEGPKGRAHLCRPPVDLALHSAFFPVPRKRHVNEDPQLRVKAPKIIKTCAAALTLTLQRPRSDE